MLTQGQRAESNSGSFVFESCVPQSVMPVLRCHRRSNAVALTEINVQSSSCCGFSSRVESFFSPSIFTLTQIGPCRSAAYNLLCALTCTFNLKIEGQLLETSGLCIPANNTLFIVSISKTLAANEPHLTLEFLEECISGFSKSSQYNAQRRL